MEGDVMRHSPSDVDRLQQAILDLYDYRDAAEFRDAAPRIMLGVIPAEEFAVGDCEVDVATQALKITGIWDTQGYLSAPMQVARLEHAGYHHPFTQHIMKTGDPSALKFSDFFTMRQFRNTKLYTEVYRPVEVGRLLGALIVRGQNEATTLNSFRGASERDFTERDRLMMNLLRPHFDLARRVAERNGNQRPAQPLGAYRLTRRETEVARSLAKG